MHNIHVYIKLTLSKVEKLKTRLFHIDERERERERETERERDRERESNKNISMLRPSQYESKHQTS